MTILVGMDATIRSRPVGTAVLTAAALIFLCVGTVFGQDADSAALPPDALDPPAWPRSATIFPTPDPFSVNGYDALQAIALLRRAGMVMKVDGDFREIIAVRSVEAEKIPPIDSMPEGHVERYDLLLNGEPLRWDLHYVEYGGRMVNLQLLFTYRNQRPVPDVPFILDEFR